MYQITNRFKDHSEMNEKIHSGQFMLSKYDDESDSEDTETFQMKEKSYNLDSRLIKQNFQYIDRSHSDQKLMIDESLNTMFRYLSIAMSGKITNPKWNSFKGVEFLPKDKIRLNNIIWREYHMQFVKKLNPVVVQFASPLAESVQINGNVVLEGKYWKRKINIIIHQYKKWRQFYKLRLMPSEDHSRHDDLFNSILAQQNVSDKLFSTSSPPNLNDIFMDLDELQMPIGDMCGVQRHCQVIQPQLTNLQPRMESPLDFLSDYFCVPRKVARIPKLCSSEISQPIVQMRTQSYPRGPVPMYSDFMRENATTRLPPDASYELRSPSLSCRRMPSTNTRPQYQQRHKIYYQKNAADLIQCKTPNLLSILLQPLASTASQLPQSFSVDAAAVSGSINKQALLITTSNYLSNRNELTIANDSSMNVDNKFQQQKPSQDVPNYKKSHDMNYTEHTSANPKFPNSTPTSVLNQSMRMRVNLNANNVVQQYLEELSSLLMSTCDQNKISKAALLHKASENIKRLRLQKHKLQSEIVTLQSEIDSLQHRFSAFCSQLPATGVCLTNNKSSEGKRWFDDFVIKQSVSNWKFYVFAMIFESLFNGYNMSVNTVSIDTLAHNVAFWLEKECSLMKLRLIVINGMRTISRRTSIVHNPKQFEEEIRNLISSNGRVVSFAMASSSASSSSCPAQLRPSYHSVDTHSARLGHDHSKSAGYQTSTNNDNSWPQKRPFNFPECQNV